jgi:diguanylate cyclase (GGDEF)-like protein/PAS domain S-box-containing protein
VASIVRFRAAAPVVATYAAGPVAAVVIIWLRSRELILSPYRVLAVLLFLTSCSNLAAQYLTRNAPRAVRVHTVAAVAAASTAAVLYAAGWGPVVTIGFAIGAVEVMRREDADAWWPALAWSIVAILCGQLAIEIGVAPSILRPSLAHAVAVTGLLCLALVVYSLGFANRSAERAFRDAADGRRQFHQLLQYAADVIAHVDGQGKIAFVSPAVHSFLGCTPEECRGAEIVEVVHPDEQPRWLQLLGELAVDVPGHIELRLLHADGSERIGAFTVTRHDDGTMVVNVHDVTRQRELEEQLRRQATIDMLTGLPNRHALMEALESSDDAVPSTALFIDLDGFKEINDRFGHERGDAALREAAQRIASTMPAGVLVGRLGGDEFLVFAPGRDVPQAQALAFRVIDALAEPWVDIDGLHIGASIGVAQRTAGEPVDALIHRADEAMYAAKSAKGGCVVISEFEAGVS